MVQWAILFRQRRAIFPRDVPLLLELDRRYDESLRHVHMFNHLEYESTTLDEEYQRDLINTRTIQKPENYYPKNNTNLVPINTWRANAYLLFNNWLNLLYQTTPFNIDKIGCHDFDLK